jgi:hypothetical protein
MEGLAKQSLDKEPSQKHNDTSGPFQPHNNPPTESCKAQTPPLSDSVCRQRLTTYKVFRLRGASLDPQVKNIQSKWKEVLFTQNFLLIKIQGLDEQRKFLAKKYKNLAPGEQVSVTQILGTLSMADNADLNFEWSLAQLGSTGW